jgi:hypothetical protein
VAPPKKGETVGGAPLGGKYNNPMMPVAWTNTFKAHNGKAGRAFCTTMGASQDFANGGVRRLLINATYWTLGMEAQIKERSNVDIVGDFKATQYKSGGHVKGVKPATLKMEK